MKCSDIMKADVESCLTTETVDRVAVRMRDRNIGFIPVCNDDGMVVGTLTDRDLAIRVLAEHRPPASTKVEEVMTNDVVCCRPEDDLDEAEMLMSKHKKSRIVCVDSHMRPQGIVSLSDVADWEHVGKASAILRSVSQREARP